MFNNERRKYLQLMLSDETFRKDAKCPRLAFPIINHFTSTTIRASKRIQNPRNTQGVPILVSDPVVILPPRNTF